MRRDKRVIIISAVFLLFTPLFSLLSASPHITFQDWLKVGPVAEAMPAFNEIKDINSNTFGLRDLLSFENYDISQWRPKQENTLIHGASTGLIWETVHADSGMVYMSPVSDTLPEYSYLASYVKCSSFVKGEISVSSYHLFKVFLDGQEVLKNNKSSELQIDKSCNVQLERGTHLLIIKSVKDPLCKEEWSVKVQISTDEDTPDNSVELTTNASRVMTVENLLEGSRPVGVVISPDGKEALVTIRSVEGPEGKTESWFQLRSLPSGKLKQTFRGGVDVSNVKWGPKGRYFSYVTWDKKSATLWLHDNKNNCVVPLLKDIENFSDYVWSPDAGRIFYTCTLKPDKKGGNLKRLQGMEERWPWYKNRNFIYMVSLSDGQRIRLTAGNLATNLNSVSPDGKKLLFTQSRPDYSQRPYSVTEFYILNISDNKIDSLFSDRWAESAIFSPDGKRLLVKGGPSSFGGIGVNVPEGVIPNESDGQVFIYDMKTRKADPITKNFIPSVEQIFWNRKDKRIYLVATDRDYVHVYSYDPENKKFKMINTGIDVVRSFKIADNNSIAVYIGSGVSRPPVAYCVNLRKNRPSIISDPSRQEFADVKFGKSEDWCVSLNDSTEIDGRIYFPPDFDPSVKYPCIVYYYAGTVPVTRDFGGRYPKEVWAANGYVVYVPQPSGATGYGQEFSARHVNNWGKTVTGEIIQCTEKFLDSHSFVDRNRVGCIGASYGGFMTMLLVTRTNIFSAAVAHAGISSISSYWGEGYWGYSYSATATANSFPWNRKDIYVDQSPLFYADRVKTPILLLHGTVDTNVPPGESIQFYTALKLLGRDVELVMVKGQNHHIMEYSKRKKWSKTILAYFDWKLKGDKRWWDSLYTDE